MVFVDIHKPYTKFEKIRISIQVFYGILRTQVLEVTNIRDSIKKLESWSPFLVTLQLTLL